VSNSIFVNLDESSYGTVKSSFDIIREKTGRKFFHAPVILNAFAADSFVAAWLPGAIAFFDIFFTFAFFHGRLRRE